MTDAQLLTTIQADSQATALANAGNDAACAARIDAILPALPARYIPWTLCAYFGATRGIRSRIQDACQKAGSFASISDAARSVALTYYDAVASDAGPGLDASDPNIVGAIAGGGPYVGGSGATVVTPGLLDVMVSAGLLNAAAASGQPIASGSKDDLLSLLPTIPQTIAAGDVSRVWAQFRPGGLIDG